MYTFLSKHLKVDVDASILCSKVPDASRYGTIELDCKDFIVSFNEKTGCPRPGLINAGVYLFDRNILDEISNAGPSLERDFFQKQPSGRLYAMSGSYTFLDIGTPKDLARAPEVLSGFL